MAKEFGPKPAQSSLEYKSYIDSSPEHQDIRTTQVIAEIFNPLVKEFADRVGIIDEKKLISISPMGEIPVIRDYIEDQWYYEPCAFNNKILPSVDSYYHSFQEAGIGNLSLIVPIGEYGETLGYASTVAGMVLLRLLDETMHEPCNSADENYGWLLHSETFQRNTLDTLREGVQTTAATFAILTAQKVEGFEDDPITLYKQLVNSNVVNQLAAKLPFGKILPMANRGKRFIDPLNVIEGKVSLSSGLLKDLNKERNDALQQARPGARAKGCPATRKTIELAIDPAIPERESGVNLLAVLYVDCVEYYYNLAKQNEAYSENQSNQ